MMNVKDMLIDRMGRWERLLLVGILSISLFFIAFNPLGRAGFGFTSDEGFYYRYAVHIQANGSSGFNELTQWYSRDLEAKKHPAPIRIGYITMCAFVFDQWGVDYVWMGVLSIVFFFLFVALNFFYLRKHFGYDFGLIVTVLLATSPLLLGLSRRALVDVPVNFFWAMLLWAVFEVFMIGVSRWRVGLIIFSLIAAMLFKEASVVLAAVVLVLAFIFSFSRKEWHVFGVIFFAVGFSFFMYFCVMILAFGGIHGVLKGWGGVLLTHASLSASSPYALYYSSGPWFRYVLDFLLLSPVSLLLVMGYLFHFLVGDKKDRATIYWLLVLLLIYFLFNLPAHSKVVRSVSILEIPLAFLTARAAVLLCSRESGVFKSLSAPVLVGFIAILNFISFLKIFYIPGLLDPISYNLLILQGFIPLCGR